MAPTTTCACCNRSYDAISMVKCSICKKNFKNTCMDISSAEVRTLNTNKGYDWSCKTCRAIGSDIKDLKSLILKLQDEIKSLRETSCSQTASLIDDDMMEQIVMEVSDRAKRRRNVIIFGIPEPAQNTTSSERISKDHDEVAAVLEVITPELDVAGIKPVRLGRFTTGKNRPLKIQLDTEEQVIGVIKNSTRLRNTKFDKKVSVSFDRTSRQQAFYKKVKSELVERQNSGESNLKIKHINGIPKIVSMEN